MRSELLNRLVCPIHKSSLIQKAMQYNSHRAKYGYLYCQRCNDIVGSVKYGKVEFLRVEKGPLLDEVTGCESFHYQRVSWRDPCVKSKHFEPYDIGWNVEGTPGCLFSDSNPEARIEITTDATDVSLRFLTHPWSGCVTIEVDGKPYNTIDLYSESGNDIRAFEIFRSVPGKKTSLLKEQRAIKTQRVSKSFSLVWMPAFLERQIFFIKTKEINFPKHTSLSLIT
ncbi:MAG: hypothetical protein ACK5O7_00830 [Holosporales bacterium]